MADIKLLLVEDDENLAYMEKSCFEDIIEGYEVKTAVNGRQGLEEWKTFQLGCSKSIDFLTRFLYRNTS